MHREQTIAELRRYFEANPAGIVAAYLFGSVARGEPKATSDVDVGVVLVSGRPQSLEALDQLAMVQDELTDMIGRPVDLVPLNGAPPDLLHRVLLDRVLLFESDHERRIEFEVHARNEYFDLAPRLERYRLDVLRRA